MKSPMWLGSYAHGGVFEIDVALSGEASFRITKSGHQVKLEAGLLIERASLEQLCQFRVLIDWADGFNEARPVGGVEEFSFAVLLHQLGDDHELVVDAFALLTLLHAMGSKVEKVLTFNLVNKSLVARLFERFKNGPVGAEGTQRSVIANILQIAVERRG